MTDGFVRPLSAEQLRIPPALLDEVLGPDRAPPLANRALLEALDATDVLVFRGVRYRVPPVGFLDGLALSEALDRFETLATADSRDGVAMLVALREAFDVLIGLMVPLVTPIDVAPVSRVRAVWRRLWRRPPVPHPFSLASAREVADLAAFFWARRLGSTVRSPSRPARLPRSTT